MNKDVLVKVAFVVAGLPLIVYPFVLLANIMSLSAGSQGIGKIFLITSTLYPAVFIYVITKYKSAKKIQYIIGLYLYLVIVIAFMILWLNI